VREHPGPERKAPPTRFERPSPSPNAIRVFLCDDVEDVRILLRAYLEETDDVRVVGEAADGASALEGIAATQPDVIVLDLAIPKLDGLEVLRAIRKRALDARIVVFSGFTAPRIQAATRRLGAGRFVVKGEPLESVRTAIRELAPVHA
jgi:DNA-binding NarL/FixJ family response regulator